VAATSASPARRFLAARQVPRVRAFERGLVARAEGVSGVSAHDVEVLAALDPPRPPLLVPNGVDLERYAFRAAPAPAETLFFVGDLSWAPNAEGMAWFQKRVWPVLRRLVPAARARVMGRGAGPRLRRGAPAGVEYVGEGADTRGEWREAAASFVPLRAGGGTRLKILEAAACGVPVVSTSVGAAGLAFEPEEEILLRDEPEGFAEALAGLLRDPDRRRRQASAARARVEREYGWRAIGERFAAELLRRRGDA
jgi:glycosyltransferase involved in cell wall biosynthesis